MKIQGPDKTGQTDKSRKKDKAQPSDGSFGELLSQGTQESQQSSTTQSIANVDSLLSVQAAEDPGERAARQRMQRRATLVLDELEKIRMGLLSGNLTLGHMVDVADVIASHREKVTDAELSAIMDEVDLRAQVEIAKMRVSLDRQAAQN